MSAIDKVKQLATGLEFLQSPTLDDLIELAAIPGDMRNTAQWVAADLLNQARQDVPHGQKADWWGKVAGVLHTTYGYTDATYQNWASIASAWPIDQRWESLSFSHHAVLVSLNPEQRAELMTLALEYRWSKGILEDERDRRYYPETHRQRYGTDADQAHGELAQTQAELQAAKLELARVRSEIDGAPPVVDGNELDGYVLDFGTPAPESDPGKADAAVSGWLNVSGAPDRIKNAYNLLRSLAMQVTRGGD